MAVRFCPELGLDHCKVPVHLQEEGWSIIPEDGDPDLDAESTVDLEIGSEWIDDEDGDEILDYGYGGEEEEEEEEDQQEEDEEIGPEDGEEPFNHDMNILDQEGYGAL